MKIKKAQTGVAASSRGAPPTPAVHYTYPAMPIATEIPLVAAPWTHHVKTDCPPGHGSIVDLESPAGSAFQGAGKHVSLSACQAACLEMDACDAIVFHLPKKRSTLQDAGSCYRRGSMALESCVEAQMQFHVFERPPAPPPLSPSRPPPASNSTSGLPPIRAVSRASRAPPVPLPPLPPPPSPPPPLAPPTPLGGPRPARPPSPVVRLPVPHALAHGGYGPTSTEDVPSPPDDTASYVLMVVGILFIVTGLFLVRSSVLMRRRAAARQPMASADAAADQGQNSCSTQDEAATSTRECSATDISGDDAPSQPQAEQDQQLQDGTAARSTRPLREAAAKFLPPRCGGSRNRSHTPIRGSGEGENELTFL